VVAPRYLLGIDLGTSNCAMAAVMAPAQGSRAPVQDVAIWQVHAVGEAAARPLLPSFLYLPGAHELPPEAIRLPWDAAPPIAVGEFARWQGARVPGRLVASAKSWLCHPGVDRAASILPWGAPPEVAKLSPVTASAELLRHLVHSWEHTHPDAPVARQEVVLTVPASFDEAARSLTVDAARQAGLEHFSLLEEPQAAFYDFMARHRRDLGAALEGVRLVLVVDVGGGTTDFTLIQITASPTGPLLRRLAVSDHLLLGGDNMDAALGRIAEARMTAGGRPLSAVQWGQLVQASRVAKEALLDPRTPGQFHLSIAGEGSRLIGGTLSATLTRGEVEQAILEGFFPRSGPEDRPAREARSGLQEFGLPYAQDPAVPRHLAAFLAAHAAAGAAALEASGAPADAGGLPRPDALLLNGGVFNSARLAERLAETVSGWWPRAPAIRLLPHVSLDLAVARGSAYYALARRGQGRRIGGGTARAYYVGLDEKAAPEPVALCVIPRGQEEGVPVEVANRVFQLTLGRPVQFPLFATTADRADAPGDIVPVSDALASLPPLHSVLTPAEEARGAVPVHLRSVLTPIGTLELSCVSNVSPEQWRLEFGLRGAPAGEDAMATLPPEIEAARRGIQQTFGVEKGRPSAPGRTPPQPKQLWALLEAELGPRGQWSLPVLRDLWAAVFACTSRRRRSAQHERLFFQLLGYLLRPGFGYPVDDWRCEQAFPLFGHSVPHLSTAPVWIEFWVMWRRIAGGLTEKRQAEIWGYLKPHLAYRLSPPTSKQAGRPKGKPPEGLDEMVRLAAALEQLPPEEKLTLGGWIAPRLRDPAQAGGPWAWALGRLGARVPLYGSVHQTIPADRAAEWIDVLLHLQGGNPEEALFAAVNLGRMTGDRLRDVDAEARGKLVSALEAVRTRPAWIRLVTEIVELERADAARVLGDTLPIGLRLA
jgi:molecular chaperone DnaK (HSP70)